MPEQKFTIREIAQQTKKTKTIAFPVFCHIIKYSVCSLLYYYFLTLNLVLKNKYLAINLHWNSLTYFVPDSQRPGCAHGLQFLMKQSVTELKPVVMYQAFN